MSAYTQQYYILRAEKQDNIPFLGPDENTVERNPSFERQSLGSPPLVFKNTEKEQNISEGVKDQFTQVKEKCAF